MVCRKHIRSNSSFGFDGLFLEQNCVLYLWCWCVGTNTNNSFAAWEDEHLCLKTRDLLINKVNIFAKYTLNIQHR